MSKQKKNRRRVVRKAKRAAAEARVTYRQAPMPLGVIAIACTDPACLEGIHHLDPSGAGDSARTRNAPAGKRGRSSDSSDYGSEGATSGHGTQPPT